LIDERSHYYDYTHQSTKDFARLFNELLKEFKDGITQEEFAKKIGYSGQSQISKISSGEKNLSTDEQYRILSAFLELCVNQSAEPFKCSLIFISFLFY
jgi:transcriptional regulator with XRE-family HTH domain